MSRTFRLALVLIGLALFASCQSSSPVDSSNAPVDVTVPMKADSIHPLDSLQPFHTPTDSGLAVRGALAAGGVYNVAIHLSSPLNGGVLKFHYTAFGLRIFTASFTQEGRNPDLKLTGFDTTVSEKLALELLTDFDSARTRSPSTHSRRTDPVSVQIQDLRAFYVGLLLAGDSAYAGFPATIPAGMDTVGLRGEVLVAAVGTGKTLTQLVTTWSLDLDSTKARIAIVALVVKGTIKDTSMVFPPSTVRLKQGISVSPDPVVAGTRAKLAGAFSWNPGPLPSIVSTVLREGVATSKVRVFSSVSLAQSDTTLSMADGYLVEVDPSADTGAYVLSIQLTNGGDVVRSEARFRVVAPDQRVDATPPSLSIQSPSKDTTVPNATSSIVVVAIATDSAGIDSVKISGHKLTTTPYSASVDLAVGTDTIVVQAWGKSGLRSTKTVVVMRAKSSGDTTKAVIKRVGVSNDTTVENSTVSLLLSWVVTDDSALAKVTLNDSILTSASGLYSKTVKLSVGKNPFVLAAMDVRGNPKFDTLVVTRLALVDTTRPVLSIVSPSKDTTVPNGTASIQVVVSAIDASGIDSVKIGSQKLTATPYTASIDLAVGSDTIVVQVWDKAGLRSTKSVVVTRGKSLGDTTRPVIKRTAPKQDTTVEYSTSSISLAWTVTDDSALAKVTLNDSVLSSTSANFVKSQNLLVGKNTFVLKAFDGHGNPASDTVVVMRGSYQDKIAPTVRSADSATVSKSVPFQVATLRLSWLVADNDALKMVTIQDSIIKGDMGVFSRSVNLPLGKSVWKIVATDTANNSKNDSVVIYREIKDTVHPVIKLSSNIKLNFPFDSVSARIGWGVADNHKVKEVQINGVVVGPKEGVYEIDLKLTVGSQTVRITAADSTGNLSKDSVVVVRNSDKISPVITKFGDYSGVYYYSANSEWIKISAADNDSVAKVVIQGSAASFLNGVYSYKVPVAPGVNLIPIEAVDRSGNHSYDTIRLVTKLIDRAGNSYSVAKMPDGKYWTTQNIYAEPRFSVDTAYGVRLGLCAFDSCEKYGRYYTWSMALNFESKCDTSFCGTDSTKIQGLCPIGSHVPKGSEWAALLKAVDPLSDSLAAIKLKSKSSDGLWGTFEYDPSGGLLPVNNESGTNEYGFNLLPSYRVGTGGYGAPSRSLRLARMIMANEFDATNSGEVRLWEGVHFWSNGKSLEGGTLRCVMD